MPLARMTTRWSCTGESAVAVCKSRRRRKRPARGAEGGTDRGADRMPVRGPHGVAEKSVAPFQRRSMAQNTPKRLVLIALAIAASNSGGHLGDDADARGG